MLTGTLLDNSSTRGFSQSTTNLATSKEHAKRFFRSLISPSPSPRPRTHSPSTSDPEPSTPASEVGLPISQPLPENPPSEQRAPGSSRPSQGDPVNGMVSRPSLLSNVPSRSAQSEAWVGNITNSSLVEEKPVAAGYGILVYIKLAEPLLFLQGFDHQDATTRTTAMLRGSLVIRVTKTAKIKAITLDFKGRARTEWPEGAPLSPTSSSLFS